MFKQLNNLPNLVLAILSGLLLWVAWPPSPLFPAIFIALVPLLIMEDNLPKRKRVFFGLIFIAMLVWNTATTYWVFHATPLGALAWITNALLMTLPWLAYRWVKRHHGLVIGLLSLVACWLSLEWLHFNWELAWPWLALGNSFAKTPQIVQWYELTGTGGGTLWIFFINILIFTVLSSPSKKKWIGLASSILIPILVSLWMYSNYHQTNQEEIEVLIIQPNINPYTKTYTKEEDAKILNRFVKLVNENISATTDYVIFPETSLPDNVWVSHVKRMPSVRLLQSTLQNTEQGKIIIGVDAFKKFSNNEDVTATARYSEHGDFYYDVYNAAYQISKDDVSEIYIKSKLVPGVERMPYPSVLKPLQKLAIDLGGVGGSRATQKERTVFNGPAKAGTAVCYESVFGDYMNDFVKNGANFLVVITNDGWWKNTSGYKQHMHYARLRAIESRREIARSANTGVSAIINAKGDVVSKTNWWEETTLSGTIQTNTNQTFYTKYGDFIYRAGLLFMFIILLITFVKQATNNFKYRA